MEEEQTTQMNETLSLLVRLNSADEHLITRERAGGEKHSVNNLFHLQFINGNFNKSDLQSASMQFSPYAWETGRVSLWDVYEPLFCVSGLQQVAAKLQLQWHFLLTLQRIIHRKHDAFLRINYDARASDSLHFVLQI